MKKENKEITRQVADVRNIFADGAAYTDVQILGYYKLIKIVSDVDFSFGRRSILASGIEKFLHEITDRQRRVLWARYFQNCTLEEIGRIYDISRERVRQIEERALKLMQRRKSLYVIDEQIKFLEEKIKTLQQLKQGKLSCNQPIENLGLGEPAYNALAEAHISNVDQLLQQSKGDLSSVKGVGTTYAKEVAEKLKDVAPGWNLATNNSKEQMNLEELAENFMERPIEALGLSKRSLHCLRRIGVKTVEDFLMFPEENLHALKNLGLKSYEEIKELKDNLKNN